MSLIRSHLINGGTGLRACPNRLAQAETPVPPEVDEMASISWDQPLFPPARDAASVRSVP